MKHFLLTCFLFFFSNVCFGQSLTDSSLYFTTNVERIEKEIRIKQDSIVELKESQAKYLFRKESDRLDSKNQLWITAEYNCNVRENLNPNSKLLGTLNANDSAIVLSYSNNWWKVAFKGKTGYVVDHLILQNYQTVVYKINKDSAQSADKRLKRLKSAALQKVTDDSLKAEFEKKQKEKDARLKAEIEKKQKIEKQKEDELTQKGIPLIIYNLRFTNLEPYDEFLDFEVDWKYINDKKVINTSISQSCHTIVLAT